jgi:hypothetical protein
VVRFPPHGGDWADRRSHLGCAFDIRTFYVSPSAVVIPIVKLGSCPRAKDMTDALPARWSAEKRPHSAPEADEVGRVEEPPKGRPSVRTEAVRNRNQK